MLLLLRPSRWPLNVQHTSLAVVILAVTTAVTGRLVWRSGEKALLDHEIVDLRDETNLRSREFRDKVAGFAVKLRQGADALKPAPAPAPVLDAAAAAALVDQWDPVTPRQRATGTGSRNAEVVAVFLSSDPPPEVAESFPAWQRRLAGRPPAPRHPVAECSPFYLDAQDPARDFAPVATGTCRVYLSCPLGDAAGGPALVAAVNVTRYLDDLWRLSPRVLFYLIDPGKSPAAFLYHPSGTAANPRLDTKAFADWSPATEFRWPSLSRGRADAKPPAEQPYLLRGDRRLREVNSETVANPTPDATRKGSKFGFRTTPPADAGAVDRERVYTTKRIVRGPPGLKLEAAQAKCKAFNDAMRVRARGGLSYYELDPEPDDLGGEMTVALSHAERSELAAAQAEARQLLGDDWLPKDWIDYETYLPQLGYARNGWRPAVSNLDAVGAYTLFQTGLEGDQFDGTAPRLVVTASVAEIQQDVWIETFPHLVMVVLLSTVGGGSVALLMAWYVTRPLRQIKDAAWALAERVKHTAGGAGADADAFGPLGTSTFLALDALPGKGPHEVVTLAEAFRTVVREMGDLSTHLRQRTAQFEFILNNAPDGVVVVDALGYVTQANVKFSKLFGLGPAARVVGTNLHDYLARLGEHDGFKPGAESSFSDIHAALGGPNFWTEPRVLLTARRPSGVTFPVGATFTRLELGGQAHYTGIVRDMTGELERQKQLERRVEEKTRQLSVSVQALELANRAKDLFMANVSHELRAPLTVISGDTQMLLRGKPAPEVERRVRRIYDSMNYLTALVNDILDSMKIMEGKLDLNPREFDLPEFVEKVAAEMRAKVEEGKNTLEVDCPAGIGRVFQDDVRLKQVLYNLIGNATKFTKGGAIRVGCRREAGPDGDAVHVAVSDEGRGLTEEELVKVRDPKPFGKLKDRELNREGTGLGLVICKGLCEKMGGGVTVSSAGLGRGSTFTATFAARLPALPEPGRPPSSALMPLLPPVPPPAPATRNRRVLVVDDEPSNRELADAMLTERGFEVRVASSDTTAIQSVKDFRPSAILLDIVLRDSLNGWAILVALKEDPGTHDIPVIIVSVHDEPEKAKADGADDWVVKPVQDWDDMAARIRKLQPPPAGSP